MIDEKIITNQMSVMNNAVFKPVNLENEMNYYWTERSQSYSDQNTAQLHSDRRTTWEKLIFGHMTDETAQLKVLDIGTGPGFFAVLAALRGHKVTAVDMNQDMLNKAKQNAKRSGCNVEFIKVGNMLPFKDQSFDLIVSRDVTWTLTSPEKQLRNWADKLKKGGSLLYFDAEWYNYLLDDALIAMHEQKKREIISKGGFSYGKAYKLSEIAFKLPMTYRSRPQWDDEFWKMQKGFDCIIHPEINRHIYNEMEQMQYELFQEFLVSVKRKY